MLMVRVTRKVPNELVPPERLDGPVLERPGPFLRSDMILNTSEWASLVVGKISDWIDLDAEDDNLRSRGDEAVNYGIGLN
jgi:hypothetical protein